MKVEIFILLSLATPLVSESICSPYMKHCMFSFVPTTMVEDLDEARRVCLDTNSMSYPLEIEDKRILDILNPFLIKSQVPPEAKVILNAEVTKRGATNWFMSWRDIDGYVRKFVKNKGGVVFYMRPINLTSDSKDQKYAVVCMTECPTSFRADPGRGFGGGRKLNLTESLCLEECEYVACEAFEWKVDSGPDSGCWIHPVVGDDWMAHDNKYSTLYRADRSKKTVENCVGTSEGSKNNRQDPQMTITSEKNTRENQKEAEGNPAFSGNSLLNNLGTFQSVAGLVVPSSVLLAVSVGAIIVLNRKCSKSRNGGKEERNDEAGNKEFRDAGGSPAAGIYETAEQPEVAGKSETNGELPARNIASGNSAIRGKSSANSATTERSIVTGTSKFSEKPKVFGITQTPEKSETSRRTESAGKPEASGKPKVDKNSKSTGKPEALTRGSHHSLALVPLNPDRAPDQSPPPLSDQFTAGRSKQNNRRRERVALNYL